MTVSRFIAAGLATSFLGVTAAAVDQVIFKDGFSITGRRFKEQETIADPNNGTNVTLPLRRGFDIVETGPKWIIFSNKSQQVGKLLDNLPGDKDYREFKRDVLMKGRTPLPVGGLVKVGEFNDKWRRMIRVDLPGKNYAEIEQWIHIIGPTRIVIPSPNYLWYPFHDPREFSPEQIRKFLSTHDELKEAPGQPDATKRLAIAQYMKDVGWLDAASKEIDDARVVIPGEWPKEVAEKTEKLLAEIQKAQSSRIAAELEVAIRAGQYQKARALLSSFDEKHADTEAVRQFTTFKAQIEIVEPKYQKARKLLRDTLDSLNGGGSGIRGALGGGLVAALHVRLDAKTQSLALAGEEVYLELHPDTTDRIDFFYSLAEQAERRVTAGQDPGVTPAELAALAVTGWLKGKNGAEKSVDAAVKYAAWRDMLLAYQREPILNRRRALLPELISRSGPLPPEEIAQLISYLPPPQPEPLQSAPFRLNTGPIAETAKGIDYIVRLPSEYHHGRPSRLLIALTNNNVPAGQLVEQLAPDADRRGYIIVAPEWVTQYDGAYEWKGDLHFKALAVLRDALRRFRVDNDRVFVTGFCEGANFAMDLGASHPDLFAGVTAMAPNPKHFNMFLHYWRNCQKLPMYVCIGSIAGDAFGNLRRVFEDWMPKGYPAIGVVYRGRNFEWFGPEVPIMFDWMEPKKRVLGTAVLRLNEPVERWISMRDNDRRFYWVGSEKLDKNSKLETWGTRSFTPAEISADIRQGNQIILNTRGTQNVVVWLDRNMIDWSKPISVVLNGQTPPGYKAKVLHPDIELMLEQLHEHGDRSLLFLNRLEFPTVR